LGSESLMGGTLAGCKCSSRSLPNQFWQVSGAYLRHLTSLRVYTVKYDNPYFQSHQPSRYLAIGRDTMVLASEVLGDQPWGWTRPQRTPGASPRSFKAHKQPKNFLQSSLNSSRPVASDSTQDLPSSSFHSRTRIFSLASLSYPDTVLQVLSQPLIPTHLE
jgi:hypothetical protein